MALDRIHREIGRTHIIRTPQRNTAAKHLDIDPSAATGAVVDQQMGKALQKRIPEAVQTVDVQNLRDSFPPLHIIPFPVLQRCNIKILPVTVDSQFGNDTGNSFNTIPQRILIAQIQHLILIAWVISGKEILRMFLHDRYALAHPLRLKPQKEFHTCFMDRFGYILQSVGVDFPADPPISRMLRPVTLILVRCRLRIRAVPSRIHPDILKGQLVFSDGADPLQHRTAAHSAPNAGTKGAESIPAFAADQRIMGSDEPAPAILRLDNRTFIRQDHNGGSSEFFTGLKVKCCIFDSGSDRNTVFIPGNFAVPLTGPAYGNDVAFPLLMHIEKRSISAGG